MCVHVRGALLHSAIPSIYAKHSFVKKRRKNKCSKHRWKTLWRQEIQVLPLYCDASIAYLHVASLQCVSMQLAKDMWQPLVGTFLYQVGTIVKPNLSLYSDSTRTHFHGHLTDLQYIHFHCKFATICQRKGYTNLTVVRASIRKGHRKLFDPSKKKTCILCISELWRYRSSPSKRPTTARSQY